MTREELAQNDGREGRKACVAINGKIYDFSSSSLWQSGRHQEAHQAGQDLTEALRSAPHVRAVIERFPMVGELENMEPAAKQNKTPLIIGMAVLIGVLVVGWLLLR